MMHSGGNPPPHNSRFGTSGIPTRATVNVFELPIPWRAGQYIYHYSAIAPLWVQKTPIKIGSAKNREIIARLQTEESDTFQPIGSYDGKANLFSFADYKLPGNSFAVRFDQDHGATRASPKYVNVTITLARRVDLEILHRLKDQNIQDLSVHSALNLLNVFIQANPKTRYPSLYGRNTVFASNGEKDTTSIAPLQLWMGIFQSVRPTMDRIVINVDTTVGVVVPAQSLETFCQAYLRTNQLWQINASKFQALRNFLHGIKISVQYAGRPERVLKIRDLVRDVGNETFDKKVPGPGNRIQTMTVTDHFHQAYGINVIPGSLGVKVGNHELFPLDLCRTVDQLYKKKLPPDSTSRVLKFLPPNPEKRLQKIEQAWTDLEYKNSQFLRGGNFQFAPSASPMQITGRLLPSPDIMKKRIEPVKDRGVWDMQTAQMAAAADLSVWCCVNFTGSGEVRSFVNELWYVMKDRDCDKALYISGNPYSVEKTLADTLHKDPTLIVVFLPDPAAELYIKVKRFGDIQNGIATQCIRWTDRLRTSNRNSRNQYLNNLMLKINTRLGGINFIPRSPAMDELRAKPTMVLGADVSHPSPGSTLPSVAALVASHDPYACKYTASIRLQSSRVEMIQDLKDMVASALTTFVKHNGFAPQRIVYFRDGVSEGQFEMVLVKEKPSLLQALLESGYYKAGPPPLTILICGKKHHIRFFPDKMTADPKGNRNFPAGFIGDREIGHPVFADFYLQSQKGLQGTSRPCHYTVLQRDPAWSMDIYSLCHCYSRATRSVKIPAPLVCGRAKFHYDANEIFEDDMSVSSDDPDYDRKQYEFYQVTLSLLKDASLVSNSF
ncbi:Piwi domain-containing protein [Mycena latifolia]|nr:Piwi domain-containing protein [Mycena latifolia]